jgi:hypothetical protein
VKRLERVKIHEINRAPNLEDQPLRITTFCFFAPGSRAALKADAMRGHSNLSLDSREKIR